jgi:hypothetical protein
MWKAWKKKGIQNVDKKTSGKDLGVDGRIILKLIMNKQDGRTWTVFIWFRIGTSGEIL